MQALRPEQYQRLQEMAQAWERRQTPGLEASSRANPRLGVDALCFQTHIPAEEPAGRALLVGALISPVSLSLVVLPAESGVPAPPAGERRAFALPSGRYPFIAEVLEPDLWLWRCELLDDLSDLETREEGSRLAQRLMDKVMTPVEAD